MKAIFNNNAKKYAIASYVIAFVIFILIAILVSSCGTRKVQKDVSKSVDKTESTSVVSKNESNGDTTKQAIKKDVKERAETNKTFDTEQTTTIIYDTLGRVKIATIVKKSKGQNLSKSDKTDKSKIDFISGHSEIKNIDSVSVIKADKSETVKHRESESKKDNTILCIAFFVCVTFGLIWYYKY